MSSREVSRLGERARSRSVERRCEHRAREPERSTTPARPRSKHKSSSRERKKHKSKKKSKKKKKKRSSSSGSSSSSDEEELQLLQRLEAERRRLQEEKKKQKELMKANETPEEKRARRLREKAAKERRRRERMGWDREYQGYTDQDNPFGDSALTDTFVWGKKLAREGVRQVSRADLEARNRRKQLENKIELEKVKQRRLEREAERAAREAEAAAAARAREAAQFSSWARQEDAFHLHQARLRSQIRIRDGRAKPIDLLAWYVSSEACVDALEMHEPYTYLNGLQHRDLEDLLEDIAVYKELESSANLPYWEDVETIVRDELAKLRRLQAAGGAGEGAGAAAGGGRGSVHAAVAEDVAALFRGKTQAQLAQLQEQIEAKLSGGGGDGGGAGVDVGYWESLVSQLRAHRARARLRDRHQHNLRTKLLLLKAQQGVQPAAPSTPASTAAAAGDGAKEEPATDAPGDRSRSRSRSPAAAGAAAESDSAASSGSEAGAAEYERGRYSPPPLPPAALEPATMLTEPAEDEQRLAYLRARLHAARSGLTAGAGAGAGAAGAAGAEGKSAEALTRAAARAMDAAAGAGGAGDEAAFSVEHALPDQPCLWADKYRPRKPRYFNRVHTGFEWNKYNQTHYDMDNPPPKIVQGYKFNIFYPDLIDPSSTPEFSLKPCPENPEFAILRFHCGPPYEDIAFKIVNREWEYSYKRGFRCHFHNNIFQLWFHFKRYRYRR